MKKTNKTNRNKMHRRAAFFIVFALVCGIFVVPEKVYANPYSGGDGNCTYTAWRLAYEKTGVSLPGWGNAGTWYDSARNAGYMVSTVPRAQSIAVWSGGPSGYGHVAYVSQVSGDQIYIQEGGYSGGYHEGWENAYGQAKYYSSNRLTMIGYIYLGNTNLISLWGIEEGKEVNGTVKLWAKRADSDPNHYAIWYIDDVAITGHTSSDSNGFFSVNIDTKKYSNGMHQLSIYYVNTAAGHWDVRHININNAVHTHSYSATITKQPTCTQAGIKIFTCSCGDSYTEEVNAKGHSYSQTVVMPTLTDKGYTLHTCSICGDSYADNYIDSLTPNPGTTEPTEPDYNQNSTEFIYEINSDGSTITITKCISSDADIVIPDSIDGYTITEIGANAFESVISMKSIKFPSSLEIIGDYAFAGCTCLSSVVLPDSLTSLGYYAFKDCNSLTFAVINKGQKIITIGLFYGCSSLSSVTIPDTVSCISENAFYGCTALKNLSLPKTLLLVYKNAFSNSGINSVHYAGTSADWKKITIYSTGNSTFLNTVVTGSDRKTFSANASNWNTGNSSANKTQIPSVSKVYSLKAKAGKKRLKLSWNKAYGMAGYEIQINTKKFFGKSKTISVSGAKKTYTKKGLKAKKKYYIRIRAYKTYWDAKGYMQKAYGPWSKISKKTK